MGRETHNKPSDSKRRKSLRDFFTEEELAEIRRGGPDQPKTEMAKALEAIIQEIRLANPKRLTSEEIEVLIEAGRGETH